MNFFFSSKRGMALFVVVLFAFNLLMVFAIPGNLQRYQGLTNDPTLPAFFRWGFSPIGLLTGVGCTVAFWTFYLSPLRKKFNEQGQIYIFGVALAALAATILRGTIWVFARIDHIY
jgi:hypothetical protein